MDSRGPKTEECGVSIHSAYNGVKFDMVPIFIFQRQVRRMYFSFILLIIKFC